MRASRASLLLLMGGLAASGTGIALADSIDQGGAAPASASPLKVAAAPKGSSIASRVKARLADRHLASQVSVRVNADNDGIIWLSGNVQTVDAAAQATRAAMDTEGVIAVHNAIVIK